MVAHETGQTAPGKEPLSNIARVSKSSEGKVSNSGIDTVDGNKEKNTEDCLDNRVTDVCAVECSREDNGFKWLLHLSGRQPKN